jgi:uncharacterized Zn finger protein (UPF0148 family)
MTRPCAILIATPLIRYVSSRQLHRARIRGVVIGGVNMTTKVCRKCGIEQPIDNFQPNARYKDGHTTWCKTCHKQYGKQWSREHTENTKRARDKYHANHPGAWTEIMDRYIERNPEKFKAKHKVMQQVQKGAMPSASKCTCVACNGQAAHYHHWSYAPEHWLDVIPVCARCHKKIHAGEISVEKPLSTA